jgi:PIN domain nuclease of toxin-antitoxin system
MILIDTHVVLWLAFDEDRLSKAASEAIVESRRMGEAVAISDITLWEVALAAHKKRVPLKASTEEFLEEIERLFQVFPITGRVSALGSKLPPEFPRDPADRIIVGTALERGLPLVTADSAIRRSRAVPTIW